MKNALYSQNLIFLFCSSLHPLRENGYIAWLDGFWEPCEKSNLTVSSVLVKQIWAIREKKF